MANGVFNISKGKWAYLSTLPLGTDALEIVLLKSAGLVADTTMRDYTDLASILAGASDEADFTNYTRKVISSGITVATSQASDNTTMTMSPWTWTAAGGATNNSLGKLLVIYRTTSGAADSAKTPLTYHDFVATTTGSDLVTTISTVLATAA